MATNEQGELICIECSKKLTGRQTRFCSEKCRQAYKRKQRKAANQVSDQVTNQATGQPHSPEVQPGLTGSETRSQTKQPDIDQWRDKYNRAIGERDRLLVQVETLQDANRQLTAAAIDKAKFEGAYNALLASNEQLEIDASNEKVQPDQGGTLWWVWLTDRIKKR